MQYTDTPLQNPTANVRYRPYLVTGHAQTTGKTQTTTSWETVVTYLRTGYDRVVKEQYPLRRKEIIPGQWLACEFQKGPRGKNKKTSHITVAMIERIFFEN